MVPWKSTDKKISFEWSQLTIDSRRERSNHSIQFYLYRMLNSDECFSPIKLLSILSLADRNYVENEGGFFWVALKSKYLHQIICCTLQGGL